MQVHGACHCGQITFTADIDAAQARVCHCVDCQQMSGAPYRASAPAPYASLKLTGSPKTYVKTAQSGNRRAQVFCPECGTQLYATSAENPVVVNIRLGCLKERPQLQPVAQIWKGSALPWVWEVEGLPSSPGQ